MYCGNCGAELSDDAEFCSQCGHEIHKTSDNKPKTEKQSNIDKSEGNKKDSNNTNKSNTKKYLIIGIIAVVLVVLSGFIIVTITSPLFSAEYTVDTSDYAIHSDKVSSPTFDSEFTGSNVNFKNRDGNGKIDVWHHGANGHDVDYYLKQYSTYDKDTSNNPTASYYLGSAYDYGVKIKHTKDITVDNVKGYIMDGTWGLGCEYTWIILVHNDEYYLICFDGVNQDQQDKFLDSFKFK